MSQEKFSAIYILHKSGIIEISVSFCKTVGVLNLIYYSISIEIHSCHLSLAFQYFISEKVLSAN